MRPLRLLLTTFAACLLMPALHAQSPALTTIHTFDLTHGAQPEGEPLVLQATTGPIVLGVTTYGGTTPYGTIYEYNAADAAHPFQTLWAFDGANGATPNGLTIAHPGGYFGTTAAGGANGFGEVFSFVPASPLARHPGVNILHSFTGGADGATPYARLTATGVNRSPRNSMLYGTTSQGGVNGNGTIFKISNASRTFTTVYSFKGGESGFFPVGGVYVDTDGSLYGATAYGGKYGDGTLYRLRPNGTFSILHSFHDADGAFPNSTLTLGPDGLLYGTTPYGGYVPPDDPENRGFGTLYRVSPSTARFEVVHSFSDNLYGGNPSQARLALGPDGAFYGTTYAGGYDPDQGGGTVFRLTTDGLLTTLCKFDSGVHGGYPNRGLTFGPDGLLYGATRYGGIRNGQRAYGTLFTLALPSD